MSTRPDSEATNAAGTATENTDPDSGGDTAAERGASAAGQVRAWCAGRLPPDWFPAPPDIQRCECKSRPAGPKVLDTFGSSSWDMMRAATP